MSHLTEKPKQVVRDELPNHVAEFLAKGGKVQQCPPADKPKAANR